VLRHSPSSISAVSSIFSVFRKSAFRLRATPLAFPPFLPRSLASSVLRIGFRLPSFTSPTSRCIVLIFFPPPALRCASPACRSCRTELGSHIRQPRPATHISYLLARFRPLHPCGR